MQRTYQVTGFCPAKGKEVPVSVTYVFDTDRWEKGISEPPCTSPCSDGCPILNSAPRELHSL